MGLDSSAVPCYGSVMHTEEVNIKHSITDKEMAALARLQSEQLQSRSVAERELESIRTAYKARIVEAEASVARTSAIIQAGFEMRNIRCIIMNERPEGYCTTVRMDTGHIVRRRKLEQAERQVKLTEVYDPFVAAAVLVIDDEGWDAENFQLLVRQDEFDSLRQLPDVKMVDLPKTRAALPEPKDDKKKKP